MERDSGSVTAAFTDAGARCGPIPRWRTLSGAGRVAGLAQVKWQSCSAAERRAVPLMRRLRECERIRGRLPDLVAVNFYRRGTLKRAVDELNGVQ